MAARGRLHLMNSRTIAHDGDKLEPASVGIDYFARDSDLPIAANVRGDNPLVSFEQDSNAVK